MSTTTTDTPTAFDMGAAMGARRRLADDASGRAARLRCPTDVAVHAQAIAERLYSGRPSAVLMFCAGYANQYDGWRV